MLRVANSSLDRNLFTTSNTLISILTPTERNYFDLNWIWYRMPTKLTEPESGCVVYCTKLEVYWISSTDLLIGDRISRRKETRKNLQWSVTRLKSNTPAELGEKRGLLLFSRRWTTVAEHGAAQRNMSAASQPEARGHTISDTGPYSRYPPLHSPIRWSSQQAIVQRPPIEASGLFISSSSEMMNLHFDLYKLTGWMQ